MRSLHIRGVAGNAKLRGKHELLLACGCCVVRDLRPKERSREIARQLKQALRCPRGVG